MWPSERLPLHWRTRSHHCGSSLASLVPEARLVVADESGPAIQLEQPDLVIEAIRQVVVAVRDPETWRSG
jgi:pimeloyl-ACP methyl ester carboxylesterase